jgi:hypothetical protein
VHEVHSLLRSEAGQKLLLAADPLDPATGVHGNGHGRDEAVPGPLGGRRHAVDERGEAKLRALLDERRDQFARVDLHPPGLARNEEDQVQADVHTSRNLRPECGPEAPLA